MQALLAVGVLISVVMGYGAVGLARRVLIGSVGEEALAQLRATHGQRVSGLHGWTLFALRVRYPMLLAVTVLLIAWDRIVNALVPAASINKKIDD